MNLFSGFYKTKKERNKERQNNLFTMKPPLELDEWFVYLVDGEKWYYRAPKNITELKLSHDSVLFLGIGRPNKNVHKPAFPTKNTTNKIKNAIGYNPTNIKYNGKSGLWCCYCESELIITTGPALPNTKTWDHIIPKNRGGTNDNKNKRLCCYECNQEKGGLMLHSYIQMLNLMLLEKSGSDLIKLQIKIKNSNKIARDLEDEHPTNKCL